MALPSNVGDAQCDHGHTDSLTGSLERCLKMDMDEDCTVNVYLLVNASQAMLCT